MSEERNIRINKVLRELNISLERAVDFLKDKGCLIEQNPNTKITESEYSILAYQFDSKTENKISEDEFEELLEKPKTEKLKKAYTTSENTKNEFQKENPFEKDILETLKEEYANGIILKKISFENDYLESEFSDFQAFHICRGIKNKQHLYNKFDSKIHNKKDVFEAHSIAMTLLKEKGKSLVNFILSIPPLPFKCSNFKILFSTLDKIRSQNENPVIRLKIKNHENKTEEIEYSFLMEENTKYINQIRVRNKSTNTELFDVNRDGVVILKDNAGVKEINKNITPILQLFYRITKNESGLKEAIFSYGIETGRCSICGRTLTDNVSKMKGIGPVCEQFV